MTRNADKFTAFSRLLAEGPVQVHLDPRVEGVHVPEELRSPFRLVLDFGLSRGARNLRPDVWGLHETLLFAMRPVAVAVPWEAIFWMRQLDGPAFVAYPYSVPREVAEAEARAAERLAPLPPQPTNPDPAPRPRLRLVRPDDPEEGR